MKTRIQKWGNSLALRIPRPFAEEADLREDSPVELSVRKGRITLVLIEEPELSLAQLVRGITARNRHAETETGDAVGNEIW